VGRGRLASILIACVTLLCGGGLFFLGSERDREQRDLALREAQGVAQELGQALTGAIAAARARADGLAESQTLRSAVATDERTVFDLVSRDFNLTVRPDERIEIFQVPRGGRPVSLLRLPGGAPRSSPPPNGGVTVLSDQGGLLVTVGHAIVPLYRQEELGGALTVTLRVSSEAATARLQSRGVRAALTGLAEPDATLGAGPPAGPEERIALVVPALPPPGLVLRAALPGGAGRNWRIAGLALFLLGLNAAAVLLIFGSGRQGQVPGPGSGKDQGTGPQAGAAAGTGTGQGMSLPPSQQVPMPSGGLPLNASASLPLPPTEFLGSQELRLPRQRAEGGEGLIAGKYRVERLIGQGGMSEVYLGRAVGEARFEKPVAIKFLIPGLESPAVLESFLNEARLQARLLHPNVVQIYDLGRDGDRYFIAMEYVEGMDAAEVVEWLAANAESLPAQCALSAVIQACEGLHAAHTATDERGEPLNLVHRDVKPSNILLGYNGAVKVADFGIAKATIEGGARTTPGLVKGTLSYMAPEQRAAEAIDQRVDVFGMGAVLYELCTGQRVDLDLLKMIRQGLDGWPHLALPSQVRPDLPRELDSIVWRALAYDPSARYPDCRALAADLEAVLVRLGTIASAGALGEWLRARRRQPGR
jgi:tRNA A-37 threonylcarbamoyl transferase component Bud32